MRWQLAQVNIGRLRAPVDDPLLTEFKNALDRINALADRMPGFVWRLQTEEGNATALRPVEDDELVAINMSVWESIPTIDEAFERLAQLEAVGSSPLAFTFRDPFPPPDANGVLEVNDLDTCLA